MGNLRAFTLAALLGGVAGGALVWLIGKTSAPPTLIAQNESALRMDNAASRRGKVDGTGGRERPGSALLTAANAHAVPLRPVTQASAQVEATFQTRASSSGDPAGGSDTAASFFLNERPITAIQNVAVVSSQPPGVAPFVISKKPSTDKSEAAAIESALSYALEAAQPYVSQGFTVREDYWGGTLDAGNPKTIVQQLFRGNEYWFWLGGDVRNSSPDVHIYDSTGNLAEAEHWKKPQMAAARIVPTKSGSYYVTVDVAKPRGRQTSLNLPLRWALAYGFR